MQEQTEAISALSGGFCLNTSTTKTTSMSSESHSLYAMFHFSHFTFFSIEIKHKKDKFNTRAEEKTLVLH